MWRLLLRRMVRCHWCHNRFLLPIWKTLPQVKLTCQPPSQEMNASAHISGERKAA